VASGPPQVGADFAVSRELILLYWSIGRDLSQRFATEEWGTKIVERLARDLQAEFPGVEGFSREPPLCEISGRGMAGGSNFVSAQYKIALEPKPENSGPDQGSAPRESGTLCVI
jgi:hypothetical protein